ncbi:MAG: succinate dehydrogenase assembly factor 2 [Chromatiales bacterium]|nr:succinate dehydrogenase assembly factor 2 [Chromatiales bacterium]
MRELDVLLERFLEDEYPHAGPQGRQAFEALLTLPDPEILGLLTGRLHADDPGLDDVVKRLSGHS